MKPLHAIEVSPSDSVRRLAVPHGKARLVMLFLFASLSGVCAASDADNAAASAVADARLIQHAQQALSREFAQALRRAQRGDTEAALQVGRSYQTGVGVTANFKQADRWLGRAARAGSVDAIVAQGESLEFGWGVDADAEQARLRYLWAAERRNIWGFYALGRLHHVGAGIMKADPREAFKWYSLAASHGHAMAVDKKRATAASLPKLALEYAGYRANAWERSQQTLEAGERQNLRSLEVRTQPGSTSVPAFVWPVTQTDTSHRAQPPKAAEEVARYLLLDVQQLLNQR